mmetsp:Transcript_5226/g.5783  ORF Transcript_5226/g.5783 Transcript_5226/m.5783 type:complete len:175 (-) Transcript_5226:160-684(-)
MYSTEPHRTAPCHSLSIQYFILEWNCCGCGYHCGFQVAMDGSDSILDDLPDNTVIEPPPHTHRGTLQLFWNTSTPMNAPSTISSGRCDHQFIAICLSVCCSPHPTVVNDMQPPTTTTTTTPFSPYSRPSNLRHQNHNPDHNLPQPNYNTKSIHTNALSTFLRLFRFDLPFRLDS